MSNMALYTAVDTMHKYRSAKVGHEIKQFVRFFSGPHCRPVIVAVSRCYLLLDGASYLRTLLAGVSYCVVDCWAERHTFKAHTLA